MFDYLGWPVPSNVVDWVSIIIMMVFMVMLFIMIGSFFWSILVWIWEFIVVMYKYIWWKRMLREGLRYKRKYSDHLAASLQQPPDQIYVRKPK